MSVHHFCTYFDRNYAPRAAALWRSLDRHAPGSILWALCLDDEAAEFVKATGVANFRVVRLAELETQDEEFAATRASRTLVEYYFTTTAAYVRHLFMREPSIDSVTYLDADFWFFSSPEPVFAEIGDASVAIVEHRFGPALQRHLMFGRFNVGWITFRRDQSGIECVEWWRKRCIEWCYDRVEPDRFADQKYLDQWPALFPNLHVIAHPGVDVAPWNVANEPITLRKGVVYVRDRPLVAFHFQGLKQRSTRLIDPNLAPYRARVTRTLRERVFRPYLEELGEASLSRSHGVRHGGARGVAADWGTVRQMARNTADLAAGRLFMAKARP